MLKCASELDQRIINMPKSKKITVGVVFGGRSFEHEVSLVSASSIIKALDRNKYKVIPIGVTKTGRWIIKNPLAVLKSGKIKDPGSALMPESILKKCDVIFPILHGIYGEDGTLQGMLEMANIAYVGAGVLGSAVGMDKIIQKRLFSQAGLFTPKFEPFSVYSNGGAKTAWRLNIIKQVEEKLKYPVFCKPANSGSSVGISKCHNRQELIFGIDAAFKYDRQILVEQGIENIYEIEVSVLGNNKPVASLPGEIKASNEFYDYDAKYVDGKSQAIIPARLPLPIIKKIQTTALAAFKTLNLAGLARVDFFVKKGTYQIYLSEVNTIPGFTSISMYPKLWAASGLPYVKLLDRLINLALDRQRQKNQLITSFTPKKDWYK